MFYSNVLIELMEVPAILSEGLVRKRIKQALSERISADEAIQCLEDFDYFFKLTSEEEILYKQKGFLLPSLRPVGRFAIGKCLEFMCNKFRKRILQHFKYGFANK